MLLFDCAHRQSAGEVASASQRSSGGAGSWRADRPDYAKLPSDWRASQSPEVSGRGRRLYAVHTKPRQEKALAERLGLVGVSCYVPLAGRLRTWQHRRRIVQEPLFPGYVFTNCSVDQTYAIHATGRVVQVIASPDPARTVHELTQIDLALGGGATLDPYPFLQVGRRVVVARGALKGLEGAVDVRSTPHRVVLQVSTLGRAVAFEIDSAVLEPLE